nr:S9 family peptidase [Candidatus Krumholzibacteria bacterium]
MSNSLKFYTLLLVFATLIAGFSQAAPPVRDHAIEAEDYFDLTVLGNLAVSPDGDQIAYTESRWGRGKEGRSTDLWTIGADGAELRRLTFDGMGASGPEFSPDGRTIFFLGKIDWGTEDPPYNGKRQVWQIPAGGGAPQPVTRAKQGVSRFTLTPAGDALIYTVEAEATEGDWEDLQGQYPDLEYGHGIKQLDQVRRLDLKTWRDAEIMAAERVIWDMALSPDGRKLALITTTDNELIFMEGWSEVQVLDLESGALSTVTPPDWRRDHPSPYGWLEDLAWSGDNQALAFAISYDGYASQIWVAEWDRQGQSLRKVARPEMVTYSGGLTWQGNKRTLCYRGESMARVQVFAAQEVKNGKQGKTRPLTAGDQVIAGFALDDGGRTLAAIVETITHTNDVFVFDKADRSRRLTNVNPQVDTWILPQIEHVSWTGADGDECFGILELPPGYNREDGPLPTIIELHGGPTASTQFKLRLWIYGRTLMASKGYALLSPNYHGSTGYGDEFLEKLIGRENEIEVTDITNGVHWLIDQGIADPAKVGVMGWSNGGYLTNCMITAQPDMFAAASSGAGVLDMVIQWGTEDTPGHVINFVEGLPWQQAAHYQKASPLYHLDRVKTPTLIHVGGSDPRVPPAHSRALYRALRHYLDVPTQLVVYPGEPHGLTTHENRLAKITWDLAWFDKYLLGK